MRYDESEKEHFPQKINCDCGNSITMKSNSDVMDCIEKGWTWGIVEATYRRKDFIFRYCECPVCHSKNIDNEKHPFTIFQENIVKEFRKQDAIRDKKMII